MRNPKMLEKKQQLKPKLKLKREIIKIRVKINEIETIEYNRSGELVLQKTKQSR